MDEVAEFVPIEAVIDGTYRILRELGRGGMGYVYEAQGPTNRWAIKWLKPDLSSIDDAIRRFQNEARVPGLVRHRNLVQVYEIKNDPTWGWFMVMELLEGETLAERLARCRRLPPLECARLLLPCMRAIAKAHSLGIIHRDLKPHNIFLCKPDDPGDVEHPKVFDFGVMAMIREDLKFDSKITVRGTLIGTPPYMCVEQMCGEPATPQFDIHAFAVIMYEVVTGQLPFAAQDELGIEVRFVKPIPPHKHAPDVDAEFSALVMRALSRDRRERFTTLQEMIDAFSAWLAQASGTAPAAAQRFAETVAGGIAGERWSPITRRLGEPAHATPVSGESLSAFRSALRSRSALMGAAALFTLLIGGVFALKSFSSEEAAAGGGAPVEQSVSSAKGAPSAAAPSETEPQRVFDPADPSWFAAGSAPGPDPAAQQGLPTPGTGIARSGKTSGAQQLHGTEASEVARAARSSRGPRESGSSKSRSEPSSSGRAKPGAASKSDASAGLTATPGSLTKAPSNIAVNSPATKTPTQQPSPVAPPAQPSQRAAAPQPEPPPASKPPAKGNRLIDMVLVPPAKRAQPPTQSN